MERKGDVIIGEFLVKLVVAVIVILALVLFLWKLFGFFSSENEKSRAEATLEEFTSTLGALETREDKKAEFIFLNPKGWLVFFPFMPQKDKFIPPPLACKEKRCVCICADEICLRIFACKEVKYPVYEIKDGKESSAYFKILQEGIEINIELKDSKFILSKND